MSLVRLLHLVSPNLPVGAFAFSQGIEWAVESGWLRTHLDLDGWVRDQMEQSVASLDLPLLVRMRRAAASQDPGTMSAWIDWLVAARETSELRLEESQRGRAMADLLMSFGLLQPRDWRPVLARSPCAGFAFAAAHWEIPERDMVLGYLWGWAENLVLAAVKIVPLGQTQGQQVLQGLIEAMSGVVDGALDLPDESIGASSPALAIASANHETQYTRLFRS